MIERFDIFTTTITQIYKSLQKIKNREMTEVNLKGIHVMCLFRLNRNPDGMTLTALSAACEEDKAAMSRTVSELAGLGYVKTAEGRRYRAPVVLTDSGREVAAKIDDMIISAVNAGGDGLTDEERSVFYKTLTLISNNLKTYLKEDD